MPSAALAIQLEGCRHHLFKLNKDHSGHSGQVAMLLIHAWLDHESVLRTTLSSIGMLPYCGELLTHFLPECVQVTISAAHCKVEGRTDQPCWQCPPNYECLLCPAGLWENIFWTETLRNSFFRKTVHNLLHSAGETPMMTCMQGLLSVPSDGEHLKQDAYMSPSFPEIKLHNGNHKV